MAAGIRNYLPFHISRFVFPFTFGVFLLSFVSNVSCNLEKDFFSFSVTDIKGQVVSLEQYRGKVTLVVNVASECGFTDRHYKALVQLQQQLHPTGLFTVLAFPCNQFGQQEPGSDDAVLTFAKTRYGVNFPMFSKVNVINENVPDAWKYLIDKTGVAPGWNFFKYLVSADGHTVQSFGPWMFVEEVVPYVRTAVESAKEQKIHTVSHHEL